MITHEYVVMQWTKVRQNELIHERDQERLVSIALNETKAKLREQIARKLRTR